MSFRDQLKGLIAPDKAADAERVFDALDAQLTGYDADIKALKASLREKDGIKPEEFAAIEAENKRLAAELKTATSNLKTVTAEKDDLGKKLSETSAQARDYQTGVTLREALAKVGIGKIDPEDVNDAIGYIKSRMSFDEKGNALVTHKGADGKEIQQALSEFVEKTYPTTTHAKRFIPADGNSGAGGRKLSVKPDGSPKRWGEMGLKERTELYKADPERAKALQAAE